MLPTIQSLWIGNPLSQIEKLCVKSYLDHGHIFYLYVYDDVSGVPEGAVIKDANEILPERNVFRYRRGGLGGFANWFRYELLYNNGGFWVDMDTVCIKPFTFDNEMVFGETNINVIGAAVIGFPKGHKLMEGLSYACRHHNKTMPWDTAKDKKRKIKHALFRKSREGAGYGTIGGPAVLTNALRYSGLYNQAKPFTYFYPISWQSWNAIFDNTFADDSAVYSNTYCLHLWHEAFRRISNFDKNANFDENSLIEQLKRKHGIPSLPGAINIDSEKISQLAAPV